MQHDVNIVILGDLVMDLIYEVSEWPSIRKAVQAITFTMQPGGKGLNQAVAASRLGANVSVISAIGQDQLGDALLSTLEKEGVDFRYVERHPAKDTDATCVIIQNNEPGFIGGKIASQTVDNNLINKAHDLIAKADVLMATGVIPRTTVRDAFDLAKKNNVITIFNPAPPEKQYKNLLENTDYLVPNEWESAIVAGINRGGLTPVEEIADSLFKKGAKNVIITTGIGGSHALINGKMRRYRSFNVDIADTTGASDAYCATLAVALAQGKEINESLTMATAAGGLACIRFGASTSMPTKQDLNNFLAKQGLGHMKID